MSYIEMYLKQFNYQFQQSRRKKKFRNSILSLIFLVLVFFIVLYITGLAKEKPIPKNTLEMKVSHKVGK